MKVIWENSTKDLTLKQAVDAYRHGIALEVNDGKDITVVIEEEPIRRQTK